jgi:hypothetical protein
MAASIVVKVKAQAVGAKKRVVAEMTLDGSYPTGGYPVTAKELGLQRLEELAVRLRKASGSSSVKVLNAYYDGTAKKVVVNSYESQAEIANGSALGSVTLALEAWGK